MKQSAVNVVAGRTEKTGLAFSSSKIVFVRLCRQSPPDLCLKDATKRYVEFLGLTFDQKLSWQPHIDTAFLKFIDHFRKGFRSESENV